MEGRGGKGEGGGERPGIMIGLWDLTTAANRCRESVELMYIVRWMLRE